MFQSQVRISDVFNGLGQPKNTYVAQENGYYEDLLREGIESRGKLCLLTGSSKTGKTTLYRKILADMNLQPLIVRCDESLSSEEFWRYPLEKANFRRLTSIEGGYEAEISGEVKSQGSIGWGWLAQLLGEVSLGVSASHSEAKIREKILSKPSPSRLIPLLRETNAFLVVEDFHYLSEETQRHIFQQWKIFSDEQVSVIVVGTTHHASDLAYANSDLLGRIVQIDLQRWMTDDLEKIADRGFKFLGMRSPTKAIKVIAKESVGLPIIMQQACAQLFLDKGIRTVSKDNPPMLLLEKHAYSALHNVAYRNYAQFENWYERLVAGARKKARRFNTYELLLTTFIQDPLRFSLKRLEIDERMLKIPLPEAKRPPSGSVTSTLNAIEGVQKRNGFEILEWSKRDKALYILEPAFLFYLRWREARKSAPNLIESLGSLLSSFFSNNY